LRTKADRTILLHPVADVRAFSIRSVEEERAAIV